jgi:hypothetical protein
MAKEYGLETKLPSTKVESSSAKKASYRGLEKKGGNAYGGLIATISKMGDGTGNVRRANPVTFQQKA